MLSVWRRFRVREGVSAVVETTRLYQRHTRREPGNLRSELWQMSGDPLSFTLLEVFRDAHARTEHLLAPYTKAWQEALAPLLTGAVLEEQAELLLSASVPPPLPVRERPDIESSQPFGGALHVGGAAHPPRRARLPQLTVDLETIEVAAARDHIPLRAAQPCVVLGAFLIDAEDGVQGLGRTVYRFTPPKSLPASLTGVQRLIDVPVPRDHSPMNIGLVVISVEENGGTDVQAVYQALADAQDLSFWTRTDSCPAPRSLMECGRASSFINLAQRVEVLRQDQVLADRVRDDTWAGASLGCFQLGAGVNERLARFHTAAEDRRNDWLLSLRCRLA